jgi:Focal adhesion targeting region
MLSSAHILAMDTKNLLDVCDSIRLKFEISEENGEIVDTVTTKQLQSPQNEGIYCNQVPPSDVGIYDNQEQLKIVEEETDSQFNSQKILSN